MINKPPTGLGWIFRSPLNKSGVGIQLIGDSKFSSYDAISYQNSIHHAGLRAFAARGTEAKPLELANDDVAWFAQAQSYDSNFKSFLPKGSLEAVYKSESDSLTWVFDRDVIAASFTGDGSGLTNVNFDEIEDKPWNWTASHTWITSDNLKIASFTEDGIVFGDADGGFQGPGTINAQAIYENGTLLTGGSGGSGGGSWGEITGTLSDQTDLQGALDTKLETETDPIFGASPASGITNTQIGNWDTAFNWGDHSQVGYLTSEVNDLTQSVVWANVPLANIPTIGPAKIDLSQSFAFTGGITLNEYTEGVYSISGQFPSIDPVNGTIQTWTLSGDSAPSFNLSSGQSLTLMIDDGLNRTISWPNVDQWTGGSVPDLATTGYNVINIWKVGTTVYGSKVGELA